MNFLKHSNLEGKHAFLGASNYHWIGYDEEKLAQAYSKRMATLKGSKLHELAAMHIEMGIKMPKSRKTLNMYINDAIGYKMTPEQILYFSPNCFGTADAISFRKGELRIHDLKTGTTPAHMEQLLIYNALFCLEYDIKPSDIHTELRIYQSNDIIIFEPSIEDVVPIIDKITTFDRIINEMKEQEV